MAKVTGKVAQIVGPVIDVAFAMQVQNFQKFTIH